MELEKSHTHVLFADVRGFSRLTDPQLHSYFSKFLPKLAKHLSLTDDEYVNTWGDGIVIASSVVRRITQIALTMRDYFGNYDWDADNIPPLDVRISLHRGEFFRGQDPLTKRGLIGGKTINLAARIEPITAAGMVWASEKFARDLLDDQKEMSRPITAAEPLGDFLLPKGAGEIEIYHVRWSQHPPLTEAQIEEIRSEASARQLITPDKATATEVTYEAVVGIVEDNGKILLVKRRPMGERLDWMFPSGKLFKMQIQNYAIWKEVIDETGLNCRVGAKIAERERHPETGVKCHYWHLQPLDGTEPKNGDPYENLEVRWVPISEVENFVGSQLYEPVKQWLSRRETARG